MDVADKPHVAFLGPEGTYSHQVTSDRFGDTVVLLKRDTINDVYDALSPSIPFVVIPKDNSIFGPVIDTYDLLRGEEMGKQKFIREELILSIRHCLLVRKGTKSEDIKRVLSHEQALGQCTNFLTEHIPTAARVKVHSTAAAAEAILSQEGSAAICSKVCATISDGLEVLYEGIQNESMNFTRFWILSRSKIDPIPGQRSDASTRGAVLRARAPSPQANLTPLFSSIELHIAHIDRRPSLSGAPFQDTYFVELHHETVGIDSGTMTGEQANDGHLKALKEWEEAVAAASERISNAGWGCDVLGVW